MKEFDLEDKKFIMISETGLMAHGIPEKELLAHLLLAFLEIWDEQVFSIDIPETATRVIDFIGDIRETHSELYENLAKLFEDEEGNG